MEVFFDLNTTPTQEPTFSPSQDDPFYGDFYINFCYTHVNFPYQINAANSNSDFTTTINRNLFVPRDILCDCNELTILNRDNNIFLYEFFSDVPIPHEILDDVLRAMGECGRGMIASMGKECSIYEMVVTLYGTTWNAQDDNMCLASQHVDLLEKVETDHNSSLYSSEQCAICLEEFSNGSKSQLVYTNCMHLFHKECIFQWLQRCITRRQSSYSCPLCRCDIV